MSWARVSNARVSTARVSNARVSNAAVTARIPAVNVPFSIPSATEPVSIQLPSGDTHPAISNASWGPALWMILHSTAERIGSQPSTKLPQEESRIWFGLLQRLRYALPCPQCKKHYSQYMATNPIIRIQKDIIRTWLFQLHEQVNQRLSKPSFPVESLATYEAPFHFTHHVAILHEQMLAAVRQGWSSTEDVQQTIRFLMEMKCFYDFF